MFSMHTRCSQYINERIGKMRDAVKTIGNVVLIQYKVNRGDKNGKNID